MAKVSKQTPEDCKPPEEVNINFHWWQDPPCKKKVGLREKTKYSESIPAIPIKEIPVETRYPYRYCSAGPSKYEHLAEHKKVRDCIKRVFSAKGIVQKFNMNNIIPLPQYETTSLVASLQPYKYAKTSMVVTKGHLDKAAMYPKFARHEIQNEFDEYIAGQLYPYWKRDMQYKRRKVYKLEPLTKKTDIDPSTRVKALPH